MQSEKNNFFCSGILENLIITAQKNVAPYTYSIAQRYMAKKHAKVLHVHWPSNSGLLYVDFAWIAIFLNCSKTLITLKWAYKLCNDYSSVRKFW